MSEYESSYYEIALTHRQVVVSFVVLLVFVAGVFLCGVWVGKSGSDGAQPDRTRVAQGDSPDLPADLDGVEEYSFDGPNGDAEDSAGNAGAGNAGAGNAEAGNAGVGNTAGRDESLDKPDLSVLENPTPETTLAQDLGRDSTTTREAPPPPSRPQASDPPPPTAPPPPQQTTSPPPVTSDDGPFRPTSATPAPSPTPPGEPATGFVVQVFSGRDEDQAKKVVQTLESDGYKAYLSPVKVGTQMRYRVRIGPYDDRTDAEGVERIVRQKYRYETWVTSAEN